MFCSDDIYCRQSLSKCIMNFVGLRMPISYNILMEIEFVAGDFKNSTTNRPSIIKKSVEKQDFELIEFLSLHFPS